MTTKLTADWLAATIATDLGVTCKKDMPAFDRPDIAAGAYIGWASATPTYDVRIGSSIGTWQDTIGLLVVTTNEVALLAMVDLMKAMVAARTEASIGGARHRVRFAPIERADNPFNTEALRYAATTTVQFVR